MPLSWQPGLTERNHDGYDDAGHVIANASVVEYETWFYWHAWLRDERRVPGEYRTAEEAMQAADRLWDEEQGQASE